MAIYWPTPGFKGRTFQHCVLARWDFNFCVRSSPLRGAGWYDCGQIFPDKLRVSLFRDLYLALKWSTYSSSYCHLYAGKIILSTIVNIQDSDCSRQLKYLGHHFRANLDFATSVRVHCSAVLCSDVVCISRPLNHNIVSYLVLWAQSTTEEYIRASSTTI